MLILAFRRSLINILLASSFKSRLLQAKLYKWRSCGQLGFLLPYFFSFAQVSPAPPIFKRTVNEILIRCKYAYFKAADFPGVRPCNWKGDLGSFDVRFGSNGHVSVQAGYRI